ncbi:thioesterase family protein [Streptomyces sp. NPDC101150]|uniref:thioesterase family protein n=1 Tax=Streptomyces sp. NPDC101150 TaxID=3366114 RepID=UPI003821D03A
MLQTIEHDFDQDTRLNWAGEASCTAQLTDRWNTASGHPNGGYLMAVGVRALRERSAHPHPLVASAFFLRPGSPGPAEIQVESAREGRRTSTREARMYQGGQEILRTVATFTDFDQGRGAVCRWRKCRDCRLRTTSAIHWPGSNCPASPSPTGSNTGLFNRPVGCMDSPAVTPA